MSKQNPTYKPTKADLQFCRSVVSMLNDGGYWGAPAAELVYRINKQTKTLTLVCGDLPSETHDKTVAVFAAIGWSVKREGESHASVN